MSFHIIGSLLLSLYQMTYFMHQYNFWLKFRFSKIPGRRRVKLGNCYIYSCYQSENHNFTNRWMIFNIGHRVGKDEQIYLTF